MPPDDYSVDFKLQHQRLSVFYDTTRAIAQSFDEPDLIETVGRIITSALEPDAWLLFKLGREPGEISVQAVGGKGVEALKRRSLRTDQCIAGWAARNGQAVLFEDTSLNVGEPTFEGFQSALSAPLRGLERTYGSIEFLRSEGKKRFSREDIPIFNAFAESVALQMETLLGLQRLRDLLLTDEWSGLHNLRHFQLVLEREYQLAKRMERDVAVVLVQVPAAQRAFEMGGKVLAAKLLAATGDAVHNQLRTFDYLFQYKRDTLAVILPETAAKNAPVVAKRLETALHLSPPRVPGHPDLVVNPKMASVAYPGEGTNPSTLMQLAETRLQRSG